MPEANQRCKKTRGRPRIADENLQRILLRPGDWDFPTLPFDLDRPIAELQLIPQDLDLETELPERFDHYLRILAPQRPLQRSFSISQRRQNERAIRDALRTRDRYFGMDRLFQRNDF